MRYLYIVVGLIVGLVSACGAIESHDDMILKVYSTTPPMIETANYQFLIISNMDFLNKFFGESLIEFNQSNITVRSIKEIDKKTVVADIFYT